MCITRHCRILQVLGFSDCSWVECELDRGRPVTTRNVLKCVNLPLEGYFRALYAPLGGSRIRMENTTSESRKFYISMFSDKPPCMPLCFSTVEIIFPEAAGAFSYFLASIAAGFCSF